LPLSSKTFDVSSLSPGYFNRTATGETVLWKPLRRRRSLFHGLPLAEPDWVLIYKADNERLYFAQTGTHSDLFAK
jgi:hypothetical protein